MGVGKKVARGVGAFMQKAGQGLIAKADDKKKKRSLYGDPDVDKAVEFMKRKHGMKR